MLIEKAVNRINKLRLDADSAEEALRIALEYKDYDKYSGPRRELYKQKFNYYMREALGLSSKQDEIDKSLLSCNLKGLSRT